MESNLRGQKWLINCSYNPSKVLIGEHFKLLSKNLDLQSSRYERFVYVCDFNVGMQNEAMKDFCNLYRLTSLNNKSCKQISLNLNLKLYTIKFTRILQMNFSEKIW